MRTLLPVHKRDWKGQEETEDITISPSSIPHKLKLEVRLQLGSLWLWFKFPPILLGLQPVNIPISHCYSFYPENGQTPLSPSEDPLARRLASVRHILGLARAQYHPSKSSLVQCPLARSFRYWEKPDPPGGYSILTFFPLGRSMSRILGPLIASVSCNQQLIAFLWTKPDSLPQESCTPMPPERELQQGPLLSLF